MARESAGVLLYRMDGPLVEVLIAHPGGPFWASKDAGAWSIPKGELDEGEDPLAAAIRELHEETGASIEGDVIPLGSVTQKAGKVVHAWAARGDLDPSSFVSNTFTMEWPPGSGRLGEYPELDMVEWATPELAVAKLNPAQAELVRRLLAALTSQNSV